MAASRRALWDLVVGAATALVVFGAVPGVLIGFVGRPWPSHWSVETVVSWHGLFDLLAVVSWCAWAACAWPIVRSVAARVRTNDVSDGTHLVDRVARRIAVAVLAVWSIIGLGATLGTTLGATVAGAQPGAAPAVMVTSPHAGRHERDPRQGSPTYRVRPGDSLSSIAEAHYEDAKGWRAIAAVNLGRMMDDGTRFVDPSVVVPGWTLVLPTLDAAASTLPAPPTPRDGASRLDAAVTGAGSFESPLPLAELVAAGVSALVAALLARRTRQLRRLQTFVREEGAPTPVPSDAGADLAALVDPFCDVPIIEWAELAARHLAVATASSGGIDVQLMRVGRDGAEVRFSASAPTPPPRSEWVRSGPTTWLLPSSSDPTALQREAQDAAPWCPVLLPVGDDERGSWLLPLGAGTCVAVLGPDAPGLINAMRASATRWTWHERLVVTDEVGTAISAARLAPTVDAARSHVLYIGDPSDLPPTVRPRCSVLVGAPVDDADVTVLVDARAASVHPFGLSLRPPLLGGPWAHALMEPAAPTRQSGVGAADDTAAATPSTPPAPLVHRRSGSATVRVEHTPPTSATLALGDPWAPFGRGRAEVRLLAAIPSIVGLQMDLPPKRARRSVELIAYLGVHAPDPVTGDRLRTRVLGSADADAAAKTLFNTAGAARRALGTGPDGGPLLPPATRTGHYRISPHVTVDALRASDLIAAGLAAPDAGESIELLREGLALVKGEPLSGVLTGYEWWRAEGHERRLSDRIVDGTCALVRIATGSGDVDLARWAVDQARKVEPYSEALTRAAMQVAAAAGDARRLHLEWRECLRQVDDLDPGGTPSDVTERLYAALRAQLGSGGMRPTSDPAALTH